MMPLSQHGVVILLFDVSGVLGQLQQVRRIHPQRLLAELRVVRQQVAQVLVPQLHALEDGGKVPNTRGVLLVELHQCAPVSVQGVPIALATVVVVLKGKLLVVVFPQGCNHVLTVGRLDAAAHVIAVQVGRHKGTPGHSQDR